MTLHVRVSVRGRRVTARAELAGVVATADWPASKQHAARRAAAGALLAWEAEARARGVVRPSPVSVVVECTGDDAGEVRAVVMRWAGGGR
jgi:hypothetical protein